MKDTTDHIVDRGYDHASKPWFEHGDASEIRRFLTGPRGQEITGIAAKPHGRTMFINVQHPGGTTSAQEYESGN